VNSKMEFNLYTWDTCPDELKTMSRSGEMVTMVAYINIYSPDDIARILEIRTHFKDPPTEEAWGKKEDGTRWRVLFWTKESAQAKSLETTTEAVVEKEEP